MEWNSALFSVFSLHKAIRGNQTEERVLDRLVPSVDFLFVTDGASTMTCMFDNHGTAISGRQRRIVLNVLMQLLKVDRLQLQL